MALITCLAFLPNSYTYDPLQQFLCLRIHSQSGVCLAFAYSSPRWHQSLHSVENPFLAHLFCKQSAFHYHRTSKVLPYARDPDSRSLCRVFTPRILCRAVRLMGTMGKEGMGFFYDLKRCFGRMGKNSEAFYFPAKSGRKRSAVLAMREI